MYNNLLTIGPVTVHGYGLMIAGRHHMRASHSYVSGQKKKHGYGCHHHPLYFCRCIWFSGRETALYHPGFPEFSGQSYGNTFRQWFCCLWRYHPCHRCRHSILPQKRNTASWNILNLFYALCRSSAGFWAHRLVSGRMSRWSGNLVRAWRRFSGRFACAKRRKPAAHAIVFRSRRFSACASAYSVRPQTAACGDAWAHYNRILYGIRTVDH